MCVESKDLDRIVVRSNVDVEFDYFVNGIRRGYETYQVFRENTSYTPMPEDLGKPFGTQYPDSYRQIMVENGLLNPDFTPNQAVIASLASQLEVYLERLTPAERQALIAGQAPQPTQALAFDEDE